MKKNLKINPHAVIWIIIGIILIVSIVKLIIWNIGTKSDFDPNNITDDFDTEALDVTYKINTAKIEGFVDDGVTTVLMIGNNPISDCPGENGIPALVADATKAQVYSAGFADTCLTATNSTYSADYAPDAFSLSYLTKAMCDGDYSLQDDALNNGTVNQDYAASLDVLKNADYSKVDVLVFMYDANDYLQRRNLYDENDAYNIGTYTGALRASATQIAETYPHIRIIFMTPSFASVVNEDGSYSSGDTTNLGCGTIPNYLLFSIDVANECMFTVVDNYYGTIWEDIASNYLTDHIHLNDQGRQKMAGRLAEAIGLPEE
ncbi:MAG: SGNH/GDSL hydrolase family protein [Lachnospiraceae bacterium]|nr:SGNH/GDSL hydrolase family protein [Lachnospiraceae bacterium]